MSLCTTRLFLAGSTLLLAACTSAPAPVEDSAAPPAQVQEEPLPPHWTGAFTMVETNGVSAGPRQFRLTLGERGPNHFRASRGCYFREGSLKRRGEIWLVEPPGPVRADEECLATPGIHKGSPEELFEHRAVTLSPPGGGHWVAEGGTRWTYLPNPAAPPAPGRAAATDLFGEWHVAALETPLLSPQDRQFGDPTRIAVLIGARGIEAASQCVPYLFEYRREGQRIEIAEQGWPGPVCARGLAPYERVFGSVLAGATRLEQAGSGDVRLSGAKGSVTLQRPPGGRSDNPFGNMPAPGGELLWGHFRVAEVAGIEPPPGHRIDVAMGRFWVEARSGCLPFRWRVDRSDRNLTLREDPPGLRCERGLNEAEQALERVMPAIRSFAWAAPYRVRFSGRAGSITLVRIRSDSETQ